MPFLPLLILAGGAVLAGAKAYAKTKGSRATVPPPQEGDRRSDPAASQKNDALTVATNDSDPGEADRHINRMATVGTISLGMAIAGSLVFPPLAFLSMFPALYITIPIWKDAYQSLVKERRLRVSVLDSIVIFIAVVTRSYLAIALGGCLYYLSRKLLRRTEDHSKKNLIGIFGDLPRFVWMQIDNSEVEMPLEAVRVGDVVVVQAGDTVPVDGKVVSGIASIDQHVLTGEAQPAEKGINDLVFASTVVLAGKVLVQVERSGDETAVAKIGEILRSTASFTSSIQSRGEKLADKMTPPFLVLGAIALPQLGAIGAGSVLMSSFGYHLRILGPIGMLNFLSLASREGILIKDGRSLESLHQIDTVVFDKTGTLTLEQPHVGCIYTYNGYEENEVLRFAAAAEHKQSHPIAKAILQEAAARDVDVPSSNDASYEIGYGIKVRTDHGLIRVGNDRFMGMEGIDIPDHVRELQAKSYEQGHSLVYVAVDEQLSGGIELQATLRSEAKDVVDALHRRNLSVAIISGDHEQPTRNLAHALGIDRYYAETLPEEKAKLIEVLQREGKSVCFVGDGINDAIALKQANVSISLRGASTVAMDSAQIVLMNQDLGQLCQAFDISKQFDRNMRLGFAMTIIPGIVGVYGAFFLNFGLVQPILLNNTGLAVGIGNAMMPLWRQRQLVPTAMPTSDTDQDLAAGAHDPQTDPAAVDAS